MEARNTYLAVQDPKVRCSELLETRLSLGPQAIISHENAAAVLVPIRQWDALKTAAKRSLKEVLLSAIGPIIITVPARSGLKLRRV